jgi:hypothetical protein
MFGVKALKVTGSDPKDPELQQVRRLLTFEVRKPQELWILEL